MCIETTFCGVRTPSTRHVERGGGKKELYKQLLMYLSSPSLLNFLQCKIYSLDDQLLNDP